MNLSATPPTADTPLIVVGNLAGGKLLAAPGAFPMVQP